MPQIKNPIKQEFVHTNVKTTDTETGAPPQQFPHIKFIPMRGSGNIAYTGRFHNQGIVFEA